MLLILFNSNNTLTEAKEAKRQAPRADMGKAQPKLGLRLAYVDI